MGRLCPECDLSPYPDYVYFLLYINSKFRYIGFGFPTVINKTAVVFPFRLSRTWYSWPKHYKFYTVKMFRELRMAKMSVLVVKELSPKKKVLSH